MSLGDIGVPTRAGANQVPDRIVVAKWSDRNDFPEANLVAIFRYLEVGTLIDAERRPHGKRNGDLPLRRDLDYFHKGILTIGKLFLSTVHQPGDAGYCQVEGAEADLTPRHG